MSGCVLRIYPPPPQRDSSSVAGFFLLHELSDAGCSSLFFSLSRARFNPRWLGILVSGALPLLLGRMRAVMVLLGSRFPPNPLHVSYCVVLLVSHEAAEDTLVFSLG